MRYQTWDVKHLSSFYVMSIAQQKAELVTFSPSNFLSFHVSDVLPKLQ